MTREEYFEFFEDLSNGKILLGYIFPFDEAVYMRAEDTELLFSVEEVSQVRPDARLSPSRRGTHPSSPWMVRRMGPTRATRPSTSAGTAGRSHPRPSWIASGESLRTSSSCISTRSSHQPACSRWHSFLPSSRIPLEHKAMFEDERRRRPARVRTSPNGWPFDAVREHPLTARRIAVTSSHPSWYYLVSFDYESEAQPTEHEADLLVSYLEEYKEHWYGSAEEGGKYRKFLDSRPLDVDDGTNGIIFHKYGPDDWGYRRMSFEHSFVPSRGNSSSLYPDWPLRPLTLLAVMDCAHSGGSEPSRSWREWKAKHPEIFGVPA